MSSPPSSFPELAHGKPDWPSRDDGHLFWVGLHSRFKFAHHPSYLGSDETPQEPFFCEPEDIGGQLLSVLRDSDRGSVLVTGYRGTGKTSLVKNCLRELTRQRATAGSQASRLVRVDVNLSTVTSAHEVLVLGYEGLMAEMEAFADALDARGVTHKLGDTLHKLRGDIAELRATRVTHHVTGAQGMAVRGERPRHALDGFSGDAQLNYEREALSRFQARLARWVEEFGRQSFTLDDKPALPSSVVFVFDELDKLLPSPSAVTDKAGGIQQRQARKLEQLQRIVAELKFFLTESHSHQIFIAGKDVDDSWAEDQNKGEGIFESIFACNIYVPSIFSARLKPCPVGAGEPILQGERRDFFVTLAREIGIPENSWAFNTALLILPYLAEYETYQLLKRVENRVPRTPNAPALRQVDGRESWLELVKKAMVSAHAAKPDTGEKHDIEKETQRCTSERTCRRLRILVEYLTYKGRGVPRKILREFYTMVQPASIVPGKDAGVSKLGRQKGAVPYVLALPQHHLQKMNFYAGIVEYLDLSFGELRGLTDKGRVSIFHIIDYVLKFYTTGFSQRDVEHANFMTAREEFFPSRQLASLIIRILDGRLWRRKDSRSPEFRLLHNVVHDLTNMFLRYPPEQMELRHTHADFRDELERLQSSLADVNKIGPEQRLEPVHAQLRVARILEMTGNHFEARLAYYKALRWMRIDIDRYEASATEHSSFNDLDDAPRVTTLTQRFVAPYLSYAMEALIAVGRLHEEVGEFRAAIRHYREAKHLFDQHKQWLKSLAARTTGKTPEESDGTAPLPEEPDAVTWEMVLTMSCREPEPSEAASPGGGRPKKNKPKPTKEQTSPAKDYHDLLRVLKPVRWVAPLDVDAGPCALVDALNHTAVAYAKLWERASSNRYFLDALVHLHDSGDEYGVVDQMFFIGQIMVRRRDFRAAALWYLAALRRIKGIRDHAEKPGSQSGADWQTPAMAAGTHAQILAAFGDLLYATSGIAILSESDVRAVLADMSRAAGGREVSPSDKAHAVEARVQSKLRTVIKELGEPVHEDRLDEYFFTWSRYLFQTVGDQTNATDVYMRQLEVRADAFKKALAAFDRSEAGDHQRKLRQLKYVLLNTWSSFWRGARVLMHRHLSTPTALTRGVSYEWGRITDFRRMGTLLRLVGEVLREVALHRENGNGRALLARQSLYNREMTRELGTPSDPFYEWFVHDPHPHANSPDKAPGPAGDWSRCCLTLEELAQELLLRSPHSTRSIRKFSPSLSWSSTLKAAHEVSRGTSERRSLKWADKHWPEFVDGCSSEAVAPSFLSSNKALLSRIGVNNAAEDVRTIFAYVSDRHELVNHPPTSASPDLTSVGPRSALYNINGARRQELPLTSIAESVPEGPRRGFRLLALAEKALLGSYLCYRDCIPDFGYASTNVSIGQLYVVGLVRLGAAAAEETKRNPHSPWLARLPECVEKLTEYAKRHFVKAIDVLLREREQNRNTFHLMSEACMNLADVLLIRLAAQLTEDDCRFQGYTFRSRLFGETMPLIKPGATAPTGDDVLEDLQRQIWDTYRQGLVWALTEMDEYVGRYRSPPDIYYAHRNIMDPVLHFRICRAARLRHAGTLNAEDAESKTSGSYGFSREEFDTAWEDLSVRVASYESPQRAPGRWLLSMRSLLTDANAVRTDRPPLEFVEVKPGQASQSPSAAQEFLLSWTKPITDQARSPLTLFEAFVGLSSDQTQNFTSSSDRAP